jgi:purine-cytosine permease-like protein
MDYSNRKSTGRLKMVFAILGFAYLIALITLLMLQEFTLFAFFVGLFFVLFIHVMIINFHSIRIFNEDQNLIVRYFPVFAVSRRYKTIEFPTRNLVGISVRKYMFGIKWVVSFTVKTRKGLADYPPVNLSAVPREDRIKLIELFNKLSAKNSR